MATDVKEDALLQKVGTLDIFFGSGLYRRLFCLHKHQGQKLGCLDPVPKIRPKSRLFAATMTGRRVFIPGLSEREHSLAHISLSPLRRFAIGIGALVCYTALHCSGGFDGPPAYERTDRMDIREHSMATRALVPAAELSLNLALLLAANAR